MASNKTFNYKVIVSVQNQQLQALQASLTKLTGTFNALATQQIALTKSLTSTFKAGKSEAEGLLSTIKGLVVGFGALKLASLGIDFGKKIIEAAKFRQTAVLGLEDSYKGRGENIFQDLIGIANKTPADTKPLLEFAKTLTPALKGNETALKQLVLLRADLEAKGVSQSVLDSIPSVLLTSLGGGKPETSADAIQKLGGAQAYNLALGKQLGIKDTNPAILSKKINEYKEAGKINASAYTNAFIKFSNEYLGQSKLGETSIKMASGSIAGALSNIASVFDNLLFSVDLENIPGIKAFVGVLNQISSIVTSKPFQEGIANIIQNLFGGFETLANNPERIKAGLESLLVVAQQIAKVFGQIFEWIAQIATSKNLAEGLEKIVDGLANVFKKIGFFIAQGINQALFGAASPVEAAYKAVKEPTNDVGASYPTVEDPAGLFGEGGYTPDMNGPSDGGTTPSKKPSNATLKETGEALKGMLDNTISLFRGPSEKVSVTNNITVNGSANADDVARAASAGTTNALDKARKKNELRKAGRSN